MCGVIEGLAIAGALTSYAGGQSAAKAQADAARADVENKYAQQAERDKQQNEQSAVETFNRDLQGKVDRAQARNAQNMMGGFASHRMMADSFMQQGIDIAAIEQNRSNQMKQSQWNNKSAQAGGQSIANKAYSDAPSIIGTGLQIGTTIAKSNNYIDTGTKRGYVPSHLTA
jgi:hypothetical protein